MVYQGKRRAQVEAAKKDEEVAVEVNNEENEEKNDKEDEKNPKEEIVEENKAEGNEIQQVEEVAAQKAKNRRRALVKAAEAATFNGIGDHTPEGSESESELTPHTFEPVPETAQVAKIREKLKRKHDGTPQIVIPSTKTTTKTTTVHKMDPLTPPKGKRKHSMTVINTCGRDVDPKRAKIAVDAQLKRLKSREKSK